MYIRFSIIALAFCGHFMAMGVEKTPQEHANDIFKALTVYETDQDIQAFFDALDSVYEAIEANDTLPTLLGQIKQNGKTLFERALEIDLTCTKYEQEYISYVIIPIAQVVFPPQNAGKLFEDAVRRLDQCGIQSDGIKNQALAEFRRALFGITLFESLIEDIKDSQDKGLDTSNYLKPLFALIDHARKHMQYIAYEDFQIDNDRWLILMHVAPAKVQSFTIEFLSHQLATSLLDLKGKF